MQPFLTVCVCVLRLEGEVAGGRLRKFSATGCNASWVYGYGSGHAGRVTAGSRRTGLPASVRALWSGWTARFGPSFVEWKSESEGRLKPWHFRATRGCKRVCPLSA